MPLGGWVQADGEAPLPLDSRPVSSYRVTFFRGNDGELFRILNFSCRRKLSYKLVLMRAIIHT